MNLIFQYTTERIIEIKKHYSYRKLLVSFLGRSRLSPLALLVAWWTSKEGAFSSRGRSESSVGLEAATVVALDVSVDAALDCVDVALVVDGVTVDVDMAVAEAWDACTDGGIGMCPEIGGWVISSAGVTRKRRDELM